MMRGRYTFYNMAVALVGIVGWILSSCSTNTVYDTYGHTPLSGWEKNDTLSFNVPRIASAGIYSQSVGLRMTSAFPFTSISLIVEQKILPKGEVHTDTIKCAITDVRGNFLGDGVSSYQYLFPLREERLNRGDSLHVTIRHNMKREILPGVSDIGFKMESK